MKFVTPTFSENDKFDGTNWIAFKTMVIIAAEVWEAIGYLDSNIIDLSIVVKPSSKSEMTTSTCYDLKFLRLDKRTTLV